MKNNLLLIDYGNSYVKAAIYDGYLDKIVEIVSCPKTTNPRDLLSKFNNLGDRFPAKVIEVVTAEGKYVVPFNDKLRELLKVEITLIGFNDFVDVLKVERPDMAKEIGADLLCAAYYLKQFKERSVLFCFGSVYFAFISDYDTPYDCQFVPSITKGLSRISSETAIPQDYIPTKVFEDVIGETTFTCFQAGADNAMAGWVDYLIKKCNIKPENVTITGGDAHKFSTICKKYKVVDNVILHSLAAFVKEKKW